MFARIKTPAYMEYCLVCGCIVADPPRHDCEDVKQLTSITQALYQDLVDSGIRTPAMDEYEKSHAYNSIKPEMRAK